MLKFAKRVARLIPGWARISHSLKLGKAKRQLSRLGSPKDIFTHFYQTRHWKGGGDESVCGAGSTLENTEKVRQALPGVVAKLGIKHFLDAPCGDFNWFRLVELGPDVSYIGGDIVDDMINRNQELYENDRTRFIKLNIIQDTLPHADMWMCRDCLFHLSNADIFNTLRNFLKSDITYLLTSIHTDCPGNEDIPTGHWRLINLELPPFSLGPPMLYIDDSQGKKLGLWHRDEIARCISAG